MRRNDPVRTGPLQTLLSVFILNALQKCRPKVHAFSIGLFSKVSFLIRQNGIPETIGNFLGFYPQRPYPFLQFPEVLAIEF